MGTVRYTTVNGMVLAEKRNGVRRELVADPLGSTVALVDATQTVTDTFIYWPYGEVNSRSGSTPTPFQFIGEFGYYCDGSTARTYVRARHLDVSKGIWMTTDPLGLAGGDGNLYRYVGNSPVTMVDPSGLQAGAIIIGGMTAAEIAVILGLSLAALLALIALWGLVVFLAWLVSQFSSNSGTNNNDGSDDERNCTFMYDQCTTQPFWVGDCAACKRNCRANFNKWPNGICYQDIQKLRKSRGC